MVKINNDKRWPTALMNICVSMLFFIWLIMLTPTLMVVLAGCNFSSSSAKLPVTDLAADNVRRLNADIGFGSPIKWSHDGNMLFYRSGDWVYAARADGTGNEKLVQVSSGDIFSPGDGKLLYTKTVSLQTRDEDQWQVYEMDLESRQSQKIGELNIAGYDSKVWSPDSKRLMYAESVPQLDLLTVLWAVDIHGNKQQIASMPDKHVCGFYGPDRGKITLISYDTDCMRVLRNATFRAATPEDRTQISILNTDSTEEQRLLDIPYTEEVVLPEVWPWSNDGVSLAFVCMVNDEPPCTDIYVLNVPSGP